MKKLIFIIPLMAIILASSAFAVADVTIYFNRNNVDVRMYTCLDSGCNQVSTSPFSFTGSTSNGHILVSFPSCLQSPYGYAVYFVSPGYVPMEGIATYHTNCDPAHYSATANVNFYQLTGCGSTIDEFTITNTVYANEPLQVNVDSLLDAATHSAFYDPLNNVGYVPPEFKDVYYSADIRVDLEIRNAANQLVSSQQAYFDAAHGNPIYMSEVKNAQFMWTPLVDGTYTATVTTTVTDDQCSSNIPLSASQVFDVLPERPTSECYTILNTLAVSNPNPIAGQQLTFTYTKISNYADSQHNLYAIPTSIIYTIKNSANQVVYTGTASPGANPNPTDPVQYSFQWTPATSDTYSIQVSGVGNSANCNGLPNPTDIDTLNIYVVPVPTYDVTFIMSDDASGAYISGATVSSAGKTGVTNANGAVTLTGYANGHYTYTVTHSLYQSISGEFDVASTPMTISRTMHRANTVPVLTGIPDVTTPEDTVSNWLDLDNYAQDDQDLDSQLTFTSTQPANVAVSINPSTHVVTFTPGAGFTGSRTVTFTVTDTGGLSASDSMVITVDPVNDAPVIANLPDKTLNEDASLNDAFNLNDYASDVDNTDAQLVYTLTSVTNNNGCGITIDAQDNIDINPTVNFNGICDATVRVTDPAGLYSEDTFRVTVIAVNDPPSQINIIPDQTWAQGTALNNAFDLDNYFRDVEGNTITYTASTSDNPNIDVVIGAGNIVSFSQPTAFYGVEHVVFTANDGNGGIINSNTVTLTVTQVLLPQNVELSCFPDVVANHEQVCTAHVTSNGANLGGATVTIRYADNSVFGTCTTDVISGGCQAQKIETVPGDYTVTATATHAGYNDGTSTPFTYTVYTERYDIQNLEVYNDPAFQNVDHDFFRGENMYVRFSAIDMFTGMPVDNLVSRATLVSPPGGMADLTQIGTSVNGVYRFQLTPIPPTHDFLGTSQVFTFVFNFTDASGGEEQVTLTIRNNPPVIVGTIPDQNVNVGQTVTFNLAPFESDIEDHGNNLAWSVSGVNNALLNANVNGKILSLTGVAQGTDAITLTLTDLDGATDSQDINVNIGTPVQPLQVTLSCFPYVVANHEQVCSAHTTSNGANVGGATVTIRYADNTVFGTCTTDAISGGCNVQKIETVPGDYTVRATATLAGYQTALSNYFNYVVYTERYDIQNLKIYNDPAFQNEDYDFFRGENLYARFQVVDTFTGMPVDNLVSAATLVSPPGGSADLTQIGSSVNGVYMFKLEPIPPTHDFLGISQVYSFVFNFTDESGGEENVQLTIRNNIPQIISQVPDQTVQVGQTVTFDLSPFEYDIEDHGNNLVWTVSGVDTSLINAQINGKILTITGLNLGQDVVTLTLTDLDGASVSQQVTVRVTPLPTLASTVDCFPDVVVNHEQNCNVHVTAGGQPIGGANAEVRLTDGTLFGACTTGANGGCAVQRIETVAGVYSVYSTATAANYQPDNDMTPLFTYTVYAERYDIQNLKIYNDAAFQHEDYDFFRGEDMYVQFSAVDMFTNMPVDDLVARATLVSPPGGSADLSEIGSSVNGVYRFRLTPIPATHEFYGQSQAFTFVFNFTDNSGGEEFVALMIRNNPPSIVGTIPNQTVQVGQTITFNLAPFESDIEDSGNNLVWTVSGVDSSLLNAQIIGKTLTLNGLNQGTDAITLTLTDLDGDSASQDINVQVTNVVVPGMNVDLSCFPTVVANHEQVCSVYTTDDNGDAIGGADVTIRYADNSIFGTCTTDAISGGCNFQRIETVPGTYTVIATATALGYTQGTSNPFTYDVLAERYDIQNLKVYNDPAFQNEDYDFFRGENMYVRFSVVDMITGLPADNLISEATLVSPPGGNAQLTQIGTSVNGVYEFRLTPIPPTHDFLGTSQVFTFVFNFVDQSGGEEQVDLTIRNNPPAIVGIIPNQNLQVGQTITFDLSSYESDLEDHGNNLVWSVSGVNGNMLNAQINGKLLTLIGLNQGNDVITLTLTDLDGDSDSQNINVVVSQTPGLNVNLDCFPLVVENHEQVCSVHVTNNGAAVGGSDVTIRYADNSIFGTCTTDAISGGCNFQRIETVPGVYTVIATATHIGYTDGTSAPFTYTVYTERYDIQNLKVYNDPAFQNEDYDFFRGENMYVRFNVVDMFNGGSVDNLVSAATLVSPPGGSADLTQIGSSVNGVYMFRLTPIPPTHDFLGTSQLYSFVFNFTDSSGGEEQVTLTIRNNPPVIVGTIPDQTLGVGQDITVDLAPYESDIEDSGNNLVWSVVGVNNAILTAQINGKSLLIHGASVGADAITLTLTDLDGATDSQDITVNVQYVNHAPYFTSTPTTVGYDNELYVYDADAVDPDGDVLTYSLVTAPAGMTIDPNTGLIQWTPTQGQIGANNVIVRVTDGALDDTQSFTIDVFDLPHAPMITSTPVTSVYEHHLYTYDVDATDPDGDVLTYSLVTAPAGMTIDAGTGMIQWTPATADIGDHDVVVRATDTGGLFDDQSYILTVMFDPNTNHAPYITSTAKTTANDNELYTYDVDAVDPDGDALTYSLSAYPAGMTIDPHTGVIQWTPTQGQVGNNPVTVVASDGSLTGDQVFTINVNDVEHAPVITSKPVTVLNIEDPRNFVEIYKYDVDAYDPDGDSLTYSLVTAPAGMTIDASTGMITWKPTEDQVGLNKVIVQVSDGVLTARQEFTVDVKIPDEMTSPKRKLIIDDIGLANGGFDHVESGSTVRTSITLTNGDYYDADRLVVSFTIPELGVKRTIGPFNLQAKSTVTKSTSLDIPADTKPGIYEIRVSAVNSKYQRTRFVEMTVI